MSKRTREGRPEKGDPMSEQSTAPPLLSEHLIAQLQRAVSAAQRKRMAEPDEESASGSPGTEP
jgi:hypothetical protein